MKLTHLISAALLSLGLPAIAVAQSFNCIAAGASCTTAESLLSWTFAGTTLTVNNASGTGNTSFIRNIYFDYSKGMGVSLLSQKGVVDFESGGSPKQLPDRSALSPVFVTDARWSAENPGSKYGVNAGESIAFKLTGVNFADFADGTFRVGVHLQGLPNAASESLVSYVSVVSAVPEPESYVLMLTGLACVVSLVRRQRNQA